MDEISIRAATSTDISSITTIYAHAVAHGTASYELEPPSQAIMMERYEELASMGYPYLVAQEEGGGILGYAYAGPFRARRAYRFIVEDSIYIDPAAQGRGLGRLLLDSLIIESTRLGFRQMIAVIGDGTNHRASVRLHEVAGFRHAGNLVGSGYKFDRWLDTVFMQLEMNGGTASPPDPDSLPEKMYR